jgi:hypothetical protein
VAGIFLKPLLPLTMKHTEYTSSFLFLIDMNNCQFSQYPSLITLNNI